MSLLTAFAYNPVGVRWPASHMATALNDQHISTLEKVAGIGSVSGTNGKPGGTLTSTPPSSSSKLNGPTTSLK